MAEGAFSVMVMRAALASGVLLVAGCGLGQEGLEEPGSGPTESDSTTADVGVLDSAPAAEAARIDASLDATGPADAASPHDARADSMPSQDGGPCANTPTSCGAAGKCVDCTASASGAACVAGACGCTGENDCPTGTACQLSGACGTACGTGQSACNGGCCSLLSCVAFDNNHCGAACAPCGGSTPTCGPGGTCNGSCGAPGNGTCQTSCCSAGQCASVGNQTCGNFGAACVACAPATGAGPNCELVNLNYVCGCDGPASQAQCPMGDSCHNQQCATACDGQHPCNGGCCSGNDLATSTCVASCDGGTCTGNYCQ